MEHCEDKVPKIEKRGTGLKDFGGRISTCGPTGAKDWFCVGGIKNLSYINSLWPSKGLQYINRYILVLKFYGAGRDAIGENVQKVFLGRQS